MTKFLQKTDAANPFTFMRRVTEELNRAFGLRPEGPGLPEFYPKMWAPEIEVFERDEKFVVRVDLPGLKKEDVKITVTHDELTIEGERKFEKEDKQEGLYRYRTDLWQLLPPDHDSGTRQGRERGRGLQERRARNRDACHSDP